MHFRGRDFRLRTLRKSGNTKVKQRGATYIPREQLTGILDPPEEAAKGKKRGAPKAKAKASAKKARQ